MVIDQVSREEVVARYARPGVVVIDCGDGEHGEELTRVSRAKRLVQAAQSLASDGGLVVRLMDGDPALFNAFSDEAIALCKVGIPFDVVPGVSAVTAVPTYAGVPLTSHEARSVQVVSIGDGAHDWSGAVDAAATVVVLGAPERLGPALTDLLAAGRDPDTPIAVVERGTTTHQATHITTLGGVDTLLSDSRVRFPSLAVVGPTVALRETLSWFESKPLFGWDVLVPRTKDQAGAMVDRLAEYGARATIVPTISVEPPRTPHQMERAITGLVTGRYQWVGFTSVNAVRAVRESLKSTAWMPAHSPGSSSPPSGVLPRPRCASGAWSPTWCPAASSRRRGCWPTGRTTTPASTRSTGCSCRAPTSPPTPWSPVS